MVKKRETKADLQERVKKLEAALKDAGVVLEKEIVSHMDHIESLEQDAVRTILATVQECENATGRKHPCVKVEGTVAERVAIDLMTFGTSAVCLGNLLASPRETALDARTRELEEAARTTMEKIREENHLRDMVRHMADHAVKTGRFGGDRPHAFAKWVQEKSLKHFQQARHRRDLTT